MSRHSLGAYRIVLLARSGRTLLVEGETDKIVIQRLLVDVDIPANRPVVDTPALLMDPELRGLGNKAQVELIAAKVNGTEKFLALVDREWDQFDEETLDIGSRQDLEPPALPIVRTMGHSIENYFFELDSFGALLRRNFSAHLSTGTLRLLGEKFPVMCTFALAYSLAARNCRLISVLDGLISRGFVDMADGYFSLHRSFNDALAGRGVDQNLVERFAQEVLGRQAHISEKGANAAALKWACHGHLGTEVIWTCIAKACQEIGVAEAACDQIERGMRAEKLRHGADHLATNNHDRRPLDWIIEWLSGGGNEEVSPPAIVTPPAA